MFGALTYWVDDRDPLQGLIFEARWPRSRKGSLQAKNTSKG